MHELTVASEILEIVKQEVERNSVDKVVGVELEIGKLSGVDIEALQFALETIRRGSVIENAVITINSISGRGICRECKEEFEMEDLLSVCPGCMVQSGSIVHGKELKILSILAE
jgi:hydrogenase nickel incorporation protein HypA/HybF